MRVRIVFSQIDRIEESAAGWRSEQSDNILSRISPAPSRTVECGKLAEVEAHVKAFVAEATASGFCGRVFTYDRSPRGVRAVNGFKKMASSAGGVLVNEAVGIAAGKAVA